MGAQDLFTDEAYQGMLEVNLTDPTTNTYHVPLPWDVLDLRVQQSL